MSHQAAKTLVPAFTCASDAGLLDDFAAVPGGRDMLDFARAAQVDIRFDPSLLPENDGLYDGHSVRINPRMERRQALGILAHELQHAQQDKAGLFPEHDVAGNFRPLADPKAIFFLARMAEADAYTRQAEFLFDLAAGTGHVFPKGSQEEDLARVFRQQMTANADDRNGTRLGVFRKVMDTLDCYDRDILYMIRHHTSLETRRRLADPRFAQRPPLTADPATLRRFGSRADGSNYLSSVSDATLADPAFFGPVAPETALSLELAARKPSPVAGKVAP